MSKQPQKILIRGVNWIGDAVLTLPSIRSVRKAFPNARISLLVKPWVSDIFNESPDIDEIILYGDSFHGFAGKLRLAKTLRKKNFDIAILLQNAFDAALISWLAGIPEIIGYKRDGRGLLLTKSIPVAEDNLKQHQVYYYLNLLKSASIKTAETLPYLYLTDDERGRARDLLSSYFPETGLPLIGINPGAVYGPAKRWLPERFAELISGIINELNGRVVIFGSQSEVEIANEIYRKLEIQNSKFKKRLLMMAGKTGLREAAALIAECDAFVTNDSGLMHVASALLVPVVAIFGSTDRTSTGPFGEGHKIINRDLPCAPCMKRECPEGHIRCMTEITAAEVFSAVREILACNKAIFLDKDGTIIEDKNYLNSFDNLVILPGAKKSLQKLKDAGFKLIGITNQSGIGRGIVDEKFVRESNAYLQKELGIDDFYYCPHHPDEHCPCRKPEPLPVLLARSRHRINLKASYVIGDKESDVMLAKKAGATGILLAAQSPGSTGASHVAGDLSAAVEWIMKIEKDKSNG
ncbi:MAG TPA: lipopolysaccharide heptosyltransferase II [Nitrospirae bacterium]|nr:lipopolysaccharide heptosyltransferase II [Nitrospirota bacterium]